MSAISCVVGKNSVETALRAGGSTSLEGGHRWMFRYLVPRAEIMAMSGKTFSAWNGEKTPTGKPRLTYEAPPR